MKSMTDLIEDLSVCTLPDASPSVKYIMLILYRIIYSMNICKVDSDLDAVCMTFLELLDQ